MIQETIKNWFAHALDSCLCLDGGLSLATAVGCVRETNQDRVGVLRVSSSSRSFTCACVCDGMGGLRDGDLAAANGISAFFSEMIRSRKLTPLERLEYALQSANRYVADKNPGAGSTLSAVLIEGSDAYIANVGDSRIFGFDTCGDITRLTVDDTMKERYGAENKGLLQYLGIKKDLKPDVQKVAVEFKSIMLASDGCYSIGEKYIRDLRNSAPDSFTFAKRAIELSIWLGGHDNTSLVYLPDIDTSFSALGDQSDVSIFSTQGRMKIEWISEDSPRTPSEISPRNSNAKPEITRSSEESASAASDKKQSRPKKARVAPKVTQGVKRTKAVKDTMDDRNQQFSIGFDDDEGGE